ncbi:MAG TPA: hypothetical protein VMW65_14635 [Chloroflexota bacterium]|nr:hypothetical protein [Chloroflexota bacterium]
MSQTSERLFNLLPAIYRQRDAGQNDQLRALLAVLEDELNLVQSDVEKLYDNWFIETCAEWVVPYIGDLLGVQGLLAINGAAFSQRGLVANTIAYRRGKGTAATLERVARDVTGWLARSVEFFELLSTTQSVNHVRLSCPATVDLRDARPLELLNGPFETTSHLVDVRHIDDARGKYNLPNVGIFLWRLTSYWQQNATARAEAAATPALGGRFSFNPLGLSEPLFNRPQTLTDPTQRVAEPNVPGALRRRPLFDELEALRQALVDRTESSRVYFGDEPVLEIRVDGTVVPPERLAICNLSDPTVAIPEGWRRPAASKSYLPKSGGAVQALPISAAIDPVLGRIAFPATVTPSRVDVSYAYGYSADLGGGPYDRRASLATAATRPITWQRGVSVDAPTGQSQIVKTFSEAIQAWNAQPAGTVGAIAVMDSQSYVDDLSAANSIVVPAGSQLFLIAADWPLDPAPDGVSPPVRLPGRLIPDGIRPHLKGNVTVQGTAAADSINPGDLIVDGLLIEGTLTVAAGHLGSLRLAHSTLVPADGGLTVSANLAAGQDNESLVVTVERCITGPIVGADTIQALNIVDSIVDAGSAAAITGPATNIETSTIYGTTTVRDVSASDSIFTGLVQAVRRQTGCVRYCYLPFDSRAPRRYRCLPADSQSAGRLVPRFTSTVYGQPGYGQLDIAGPVELTTSADDEGELGALHYLQQTQRLKNLRASLIGYLRFGLEAGSTFVT